MPTWEVQSVNQMLTSTAYAIERPELLKPADHHDIVQLFGIIHEVCHSLDPVYWEGIARAHVLAGDYFRTKSSEWYRAYAAYNSAILTVETFPFSADDLGDMETLIRRALWERFALAHKLGNEENAREAAFWGLHGVQHASKRFDPKSGEMYWGPTREVRVGFWQQLRMKAFVLMSFSKGDKNPSHA